ncbi:MAG: WD40 repeat domain-containing protein [Anaerolineae bacterium]|jgi:WD40 repeat protein|nr:WD40 repeat domain-containing protein [Anaerolineae bacterium]
MYRLIVITILFISTMLTRSQATDEKRSYTVWSPSGTLIAYLFQGELQVIDAVSGNQLQLPTLISTDITHIAWHPQNIQLAISSNDGNAYVWEITQQEGQYQIGELLATLIHGRGTVIDNEQRGVEMIAWNRNGNYLITVGWMNDSHQIWDAQTFTPLLKISAGNPWGGAVWSPVSDSLLAIHNFTEIRLLDLDQLELSGLTTISYQQWSNVTAPVPVYTNEQRIVMVSWYPDGRKLMVSDVMQGLWTINLQTSSAEQFTAIDQSTAYGFPFMFSNLEWNVEGSGFYASLVGGQLERNYTKIVAWDLLSGTSEDISEVDVIVAKIGVSPFGGRIVIGTALPQGQSVNAPFAGLQFIVPNPTDARLAELTQTCAQAESAVCDADLAAMQAALGQ